MGAAAVPLAVGSTALSAYSSYKEGLAQSDFYKYRAKADRLQADLVRKQGVQESSFAQDAGLRETQAAVSKGKQMEGAQAVAAAANVGGGSVTTADIALDTFNKERMDQMAIRYNADLKSYRATENANNEASALEQEAAGADYAADNAKRAGKIGAFNSLLSGASQVSNMYYSRSQYNKKPKSAALFNSSGGRTRVPTYNATEGVDY